MKKLTGYYYSEENVCIFSLIEQEGLEYNKIIEDKHIKVNIETKEVQKVHSFFQNAIIKDSINCDFEEYVLDFSRIKSEDFYDEDFTKLADFFGQQVEVVNITLKEVKTNYEAEVEE
ncbi:MAG: hypothetical protein KQ78_00215 [Candidatus Izimaplasma bacterium HR2]|nr:MAG: hypothetical protein KQ78_00215 [Candidatus Izimaplasma bacterium HR2]